MELLLFASFLILLLATFSAAETATNTATDHLALMDFRSMITGDPSQALGSWGNQSIPMCQWHGVTCGARGVRRGRVIALDLPELNLEGIIASSLGNLTHLRQLDLRANSFHGIIPSELGRLAQLEHLNLSSNSIGGEIPPALAFCKHLQVVSLRHNNFQGVIPTAIGDLSELRVVDLMHNMLKGLIPQELASLRNLEVLILGYNNLTGDIPVELCNLKSLVLLDLKPNMLTGHIPVEIGRLTNLTELYLGHNHLTGPVPSSLGGLKKLQILYLDNNQLSGPIPSSLGNLSSLTVLDVQSNGLTGNIPESLGNLNLLNVLSLTSNNLTGRIPDTLGKLYSLTEFYLNGNELEGLIPTSVYNLSSLLFFSVGQNKLSGSLHRDVGNKFPKLKRYDVFNNTFHGTIPLSLCNISTLEILQLAINSFSGVIPKCLGINLKNLFALVLTENQLEARNDEDWGFISSLTNCTKLQYIILSSNKLEGMLPKSVANLSTSLGTFSITKNRVSGNIPDGIGNLIGLVTLHLGENLLNGTIPSSFGNLQNLVELHMALNKLSGMIPPILGNLTMLNRLSLDENMLSGPVPSSLGSCPLEFLNLEYNQLVGPIPKEIFLISTLSDFASFQGNKLTGILPPEVGDLINLNRLDISGNRISGPIPTSLAKCRSLQYLNMQENLFEGTIPSSIEQLKGLLVLDLSKNNLSGQIPEFLARMQGIASLNISFNNFEGQVPEHGIFMNASAIFIEGNNGLCGGIPQLNLPPCVNHAPKKRSHKLVIAISLGSTCIILVCSLFILWKLKDHVRNTRKIQSLPNGPHVRVSYADLARATSGFASENLLGTGSFGSVYKGTMMNGSQEVSIAVKVLSLQQRGASQSFIAECETLRCIRHRNLVKILTVCSSIDSSGFDFKALVFEFMPNGNLDEWLHNHLLEDGKPGVLNLSQRIDIAIDVACALEYLHYHKPVPIVHCDLKPSNILLDTEKVAHLGDFGIARFLHQDDTSLPEVSSGWATRRGTVGYAAPEYGQGNEVSVHGDTYSYGILLLEMFTGKRPTDGEFEHDFNLHRCVEHALRDQATCVVDQDLLSATEDGNEKTSMSDSDTGIRMASITAILKIGILCSKELPTDRMKISDAMKELLGIREKYHTYL
uniref:Receptor kinase-like protein Xa21 n=1 Tax=Leersia perrieri TaxID=77586 RepID=A0A0D9WRI9_9ORYZ